MYLDREAVKIHIKDLTNSSSLFAILDIVVDSSPDKWLCVNLRSKKAENRAKNKLRGKSNPVKSKTLSIYYL